MTAAIDDAERAAREAVPDLTLVMYLEPDVDRAAQRRSVTQRGEGLAGDGDDVPSSEHADGG